MKRWAILDLDTNEVLTVVEHDDEAEQATVDAHASVASSQFADAVERIEKVRDATGTVMPVAVDETTSLDIPARPVVWERPDTAVDVTDDLSVQTGDVYDSATGKWSRPEPVRTEVAFVPGRLLAGLYAAGAVDDTAVAIMVGDPPGTTYTLDGDPPVLVRDEG